MTNRDVDIFAREVDMVHSRRDSEVNPRVSLHKPRKPMHKPFCGKIGRGADRKDARGLSLHQALGSDGEAIKRVPHDREILATRFRYDQALAFAIEQLDPSSASILRLLVLDVFSDHGFVVPDSGYEKPRAQKLWPIQLRTCSPMLTGLVGGVMNQYNAVVTEVQKEAWRAQELAVEHLDRIRSNLGHSLLRPPGYTPGYGLGGCAPPPPLGVDWPTTLSWSIRPRAASRLISA